MALWDLFALANFHHSVETWLPNHHDLGWTDARLGAPVRSEGTRRGLGPGDRVVTAEVRGGGRGGCR